MNYLQNIIPVMETLSKKYYSNEKTTLNRMRIKPDHATFIGGKEKKSPFSASGKEREENQGVSSPFKILISCLLSLRARDENTEKVSRQLFEVISTPEEISKLSDKKLEKLIYSSGHYKKKTQVLKHVSKEIIERFNSQVPRTKDELLSIKGIGPKTANIVLAFAFGESVIPVDTHCHRIPNRLGWLKTKKPEQTEKELEKILPKKYWKEFNGIFVLFGKTICQPVSPKCSICQIRKYCKRVGVVKSR